MGLISISADTNFFFFKRETWRLDRGVKAPRWPPAECMLCEGTLNADVCVHASVVVCASRCCRGVTGLSRGPLCRLELCEAASPSPSLSGPALRALPRTGAPSSYLSCSLNCGPQCRDPVTFFNNREINSAPPIALSASHPANEGAAWGLFTRISNQKLSAKENTHSHT